jgi:hypothetical protein
LGIFWSVNLTHFTKILEKNHQNFHVRKLGEKTPTLYEFLIFLNFWIFEFIYFNINFWGL